MDSSLNFMEIKMDSLLDVELIQRFQDRFCRANSLYLVCLGQDAGVITNRFGTHEEILYLNDQVSAPEILNLVQHAQDEIVESVVERDFPDRCLKMCAISTRFEGKTQLIWLVYAFLEDFMGEGMPLPEYIMTTSMERFYRSVEFLETLSRYLFISKADELIAQDAIQKHSLAEQAVKSQLHRSESMTKIVNMLESDAPFGSITEELLQEVCETLNLTRGALLRKDSDEKTASMICEFASREDQAQIASFQRVPMEELLFFNGKNYVISSESMLHQDYKDMMEKFGAVAAVFQPLEVNGQVQMYLCFFDTSKDQIWQTDDLKFINDAKHVVQTILTKRIAKNSLTSSYASLEAILEYVGCGICVYNQANKKILYRNHRFKELYSNLIASGKLDDMLQRESEEDSRFRENYVPEEDRWVDQYKTKIRWVDGAEVLLLTVYDITDKKRYQEKIEVQANNDFLTGLYNRMRCEQDMEKQIRLVQANGSRGALLYIDLDDFKSINDGLGHQYGDVLLKTIGHSLQKIKGIGSNCYRVGGDEFMVIITDPYFDRIEAICEEIREIFNHPWFLKGEDYYCTTSMGIVIFPDDGNEVEDLIRKADLALFRAKRSGKNTIEYYNDSDAESVSKRLDVEKNMRRAALDACDEFEVYYQPIINVQKEGKPCCGAEALIRWNSPELGFITPGDFIPLAEYLGLINPIGDYVLKEAAKRCKFWNDMGHPEYHVNVNLSVVQLLQNDIVSKVKKVLEETRINPKNLTLEVTESLAINDIERMVSILNQIRELGVKVALDDFGTGYSSLNHLRELPLDVIKIDKCFIDQIAEDEFYDAFVKMVVTLAESLKLQVCVEGVEDRNQSRRIEKLGADMIQGFYYDKPLKVADFEEKYL